jgi:hypothetical protein
MTITIIGDSRSIINDTRVTLKLLASFTIVIFYRTGH